MRDPTETITTTPVKTPNDWAGGAWSEESWYEFFEFFDGWVDYPHSHLEGCQVPDIG